MFDAREVRLLAGLPLEKQVVEVLLEEDTLIDREHLRKLLIPPPTDLALDSIIARLVKRNDVAEYPNGDALPLIGLPGWALSKPQYKPPSAPKPAAVEVAAPAAAPLPSPSMENTMPKGKRIPKDQADQAVEAALDASGSTFSAIMDATNFSRSTVNSTLVRLKHAKRVHSSGKGRGVLWFKGAKAAAEPSTPARAPRPAFAAPPNGTRRFGYFSDGSMSLDCPDCKGTLTPDDIAELRSFAEEHVQ